MALNAYFISKKKTPFAPQKTVTAVCATENLLLILASSLNCVAITKGDRKKSDGYTVKKKMDDDNYSNLHNEKVPFINSTTERSVVGQALADNAFSHKNELQLYLTSIASKFVVSLDCDIYTCYCNSCPCKTCWMPIVGPGGGIIGTVKHCLKIKNCHFTIGWE